MPPDQRPSFFKRMVARVGDQDHQNPYFANKTHRSSGNRWQWWLAGAGSLILLTTVGVRVVHSQTIREVQLTGQALIPAQEITDTVNSYLDQRTWCGLKRRASFWLTGGDLSKDLANDRYAIQAVDHDGSVLKIELSEQLIQVAHQTEDGKWDLLDKAGQVVVAGVEEEGASNWPKISGPTTSQVIAFAGAWNGVLRRNGLNDPLYLHTDKESNGRWLEQTITNKKVLLDPSTDPEYLWTILQPLLTRSETNIDLRFKQRVYLR